MTRVLIVDDEPDLLLLMRYHLEAVGIETALAADGDAALHLIGLRSFDLVLLDVWMPVLDGWGVLDGLNSMPDPPPVIVVSANVREVDGDRARSLGVVECVKKPFDLDYLISRVVAFTSLPDTAVVGVSRATPEGLGLTRAHRT